MRRLLLVVAVLSAVSVSVLAADSDKKSNREAQEKAFASRLTGATLAGFFSLDGKESAPNKPDRYQIVSAKKLNGDDWVITSKMKIGENEVDLPIVIKVYWADDTPVMSLTDLTIPGLGTFTSRVMFYGDRYAGTWQHGEKGGHMWGIVEKPAPKN